VKTSVNKIISIKKLDRNYNLESGGQLFRRLYEKLTDTD
jgi:hypothetical protein